MIPTRRTPALARILSALALAVAGAVTAGVAAGGAPAGKRWAAAVPGDEYYTPTPTTIAAGPDGNLWFVETEGDRIGRITPSGRITEFRTELAGGSNPYSIVAGPDGAMWFTEHAGNRVGRIGPSGRIERFTTGIVEGAGPAGIAAGPDGNLWFTEFDVAGIGRVTPDGAVTEFAAGIGRNSGPWDIAAGPDGNMWFTEDRDGIGRITPQGVITEFSDGLTRGSEKGGIAAGPDGNLWFTEIQGNRIGRITPQGVITEFNAGLSPDSAPWDIAAGPDGNLWFTEIQGNRIGRITPQGVITEFSRGLSAFSAPSGIAAGPDGNLWFTEAQGNRIGRITPRGVITEFPPPVRIVGARGVGDRAVIARVRCPGSACGGVVRLVTEGEPYGVTIGLRRFSLRARRTANVVVPLTSRGRRLVRANGAVTVEVGVRALAHSRMGDSGGGYVTLWGTRSAPATVSGVVDGDTVRVRSAGRDVTVRLVGVDAPETAPRSVVDMCFGSAAAARTRRLLPVGMRVTLVTVPAVFVRDRLGRLPAYVFAPGRHGATGSVNYALVATGYAAAVEEFHPRSQEFGRAQGAAQGRRLGLWAPPCGGNPTLPQPAR